MIHIRVLAAALALVAAMQIGWTAAPDRIISRDALLLLSSTSPYDTPEHHLDLFADGHKPCAFHTAAEDRPWIRVDLGARRTITGVEIVNRTDAWHERIQGLEISVSDDGSTWTTVAQADGGRKEWSIAIGAPGSPPVRGRYLKVQLTNRECFHLSRLAVRGS